MKHGGAVFEGFAMLVYVATYPRCGSAILRDTIHLNWGHATSNLYAAGSWPEPFSILPSEIPGFTPYRYADGPVRQMLASPSRDLLTPQVRRRLAGSASRFFVKTHENPPSDPIEGEVAVQLARHPAAAITSQWKLHGATHEECPPLAHFSEGCDTGGRWDRYHRAWDEAGMPLFRRRFEDVLASPFELVREMGDFLRLPQPASPRIMTAESAKARNPLRNPIRGADGWLEQISAGDLMRIWNRHKISAREMGYGMMNVAGPFTPPPQHAPARQRTSGVAAHEVSVSATRPHVREAAPVIG